MDQTGRSEGRVRVVIQHPMDRVVPVRRRVVGPRGFGRVATEQVVDGVPARPVLADQLDAGQLTQRGPRRGNRLADEAGRRGRVNVGTRVRRAPAGASSPHTRSMTTGTGTTRPASAARTARTLR